MLLNNSEQWLRLTWLLDKPELGCIETESCYQLKNAKRF